MNEGDIAERFIRAAEIDRNHHVHVGPARVKSMSLPYVHDFNDKAGWGTDRLTEDRAEFWERIAKVPTAREVSEAEQTRSWIKLVSNEGQRTALLAWAEAMAGARPFKDWCFGHGIHPETGRRRKDRALARICAHLSRNGVQDCNNAGSGVLLEQAETADIPTILDTFAHKPDRIVGGPLAGAYYRPFGADAEPEFDWSDKRNARRREREAKQKKAA